MVPWLLPISVGGLKYDSLVLVFVEVFLLEIPKYTYEGVGQYSVVRQCAWQKDADLVDYAE